MKVAIPGIAVHTEGHDKRVELTFMSAQECCHFFTLLRRRKVPQPKGFWFKRRPADTNRRGKSKRRLPESIAFHVHEVTYMKLERGKFKDIQFKTGPITSWELQRAVLRLKRGKTPGPDCITTDFVKDLSPKLRDTLLVTLNEIWVNGFPNDFTLARIYSLYKKGDPDNLASYRPISLLNTFYKLIASIIQHRLANALD